VDHWVGELLAAVEGGDVVIALTADHGESLDEDGFFFQHGHTTTPEQARVPLILAAPGIAPRRISGVASHVDIFPTLLELAGLEELEVASGVSLVPALRAEARVPDRVVLSDVGHELSAYDATGYVTVKILGDGHLDWQRFERKEGGWRKSAHSPLPSVVRAYVASEVAPAPAYAMTDEDRERLRALGYLPPVVED
jgi:arylsulfatase A-like enzyme